MPQMKHTIAAAAVLAAALPAPAFAVDYLSFNTGRFEALRDNDYDAWQFGLEYRFEEWQHGIRPVIGGFFTSDGATYGYGGINWDVPLIKNQLYLVPNFAIGGYSDGDGKDLGGALEFRSGIELDYQFQNMHQIGIALNHLSNASIYDHNPGTESVIVTYSIPFDSVFGGR